MRDPHEEDMVHPRAPRAVLAASGLKPHSGAAIRLLLPSDLRSSRSFSGFNLENTLFICPECFRKAETMSSLPRGVRATVRTRRSSALSTRLTSPFATRRSTAILIEPGLADGVEALACLPE